MGEESVLGWVFGYRCIFLLMRMGCIVHLMPLCKPVRPRGAIAWALALVTIPFVALPLYWVFGRAKFDDYIKTLRKTQ